jgi:hypothetical protein
MAELGKPEGTPVPKSIHFNPAFESTTVARTVTGNAGIILPDCPPTLAA